MAYETTATVRYWGLLLPQADIVSLRTPLGFVFILLVTLVGRTGLEALELMATDCLAQKGVSPRRSWQGLLLAQQQHRTDNCFCSGTQYDREGRLHVADKPGNSF